ncbi:hypothetical protein EHQ12_03540 [Leptospira gomenensis]|uniref:Uncharacterized protein n=1 Tax=Leptospira gomenensis TaxID=2484974 RepID=A0A5F1Y8V5_9LEPT|nr:hypothetical protein [Leptospira gomenensis]TGK31130.1 hypothetical protein EHQ17_15575 [Leptospira gomenensis]TGK41758.1 hypothetical protein EHQ07_15615 [Leptospira gomenensis]TGK43334.1 hypothetical protein EHQ12_03540 [Leptospira gomenensis]TGK56380.1 hypothetical protein EHQ13_15810 [Leptospira gomenensis]
MKASKTFYFWSLLLLEIALLQACIPKPGSVSGIDTAIFSNFFTSSQTPIFLKVRVSGLASGASFAISNQNSEVVTVFGNGEFAFSQSQPKFSNYSVNVISQPVVTPNQTCAITNPSGILDPNNNLVEIQCGTRFFNLSLNVFGISGAATGNLTARTGPVNTLTISADGTYTFPAQIPDAGSYSVKILTNPFRHKCILEALPPGTGTINGAPVTVNVNCLSLLTANPPAQTVLSSVQPIQFTFSKPVTPLSCNFVAPTPAPPSPACSGDLSGSAFVLNAANYNGNTVTINPNANWPVGLNQCIQLAGCTENGTGRVFPIPTPVRYSVANQIKYVSQGGATAGTCSTVATACDNIQYAVSLCNGTAPCFVLVSQGSYSVSTAVDRIVLVNRLQLLGGFNSTFTDRDFGLYPTSITDDQGPGVCGNNFAATCSPIIGSFLTLDDDILIQNFMIRTNGNNQWSTGIHLVNVTTGGNNLTINENIILGRDSAAAYNLGTVRSGISASSVGGNLVVSGNWVVGGSGNSFSAGLFLSNNTRGLIYGNYLSGASTAGVNPTLDLSMGIYLSNAIVSNTQSLVIANNVINSHFITSGVPVNTGISVGINGFSVNSPNIFVIHNTIFGGLGTLESYGIKQEDFSTANLILNVINNQIFANLSSTTMSTCIHTGNTVDPGSDIRGNNLFNCLRKVDSNPGQYDICGPGPGALTIGGCIVPLTTATQMNFRVPPVFAAATGATEVFRLAPSSKCSSVFGGVDPGFGFPLSQFYLLDLLGSPRSFDGPPVPVPAGSAGFSIGAFEQNAGCSP